MKTFDQSGHRAGHRARQRAKYQETYQTFFPQKMRKSEQTKLRILEATLWCYVKYGIENSTYDNIAQRAEITRPLVMRYFPDKEILFELVIKYIATNLQKISIEAIAGLSRADEILEAYIRSTFWWLKNYPEHAKVWLLFYYYCSFHEKLLRLNTELVLMGHFRILTILEQGKEQKRFKGKNPELKAKSIQNQITGSLLSLLTEKKGRETMSENQVVKMCMEMAKN